MKDALEGVKNTKPQATPTPDNFADIAEPQATPYTKVIYRSSEFVQHAGNWQYSFSLDQPATVTGSVESQEDVSIRVFLGDTPYYSADDVNFRQIKLVLTRPGSYVLVVYGRLKSTGSTVNLTARYNE